MDRCAILVDAGFLLGPAGTLVTGDATERTRCSKVIDVPLKGGGSGSDVNGTTV